MEEQLIRFKVRVIEIDKSESTLARITMNPVHDSQPDMEHEKYIAGEPQNTFHFNVKNPAVVASLTEGQDYYVDFVPTHQEAGSNEAKAIEKEEMRHK